MTNETKQGIKYMLLASLLFAFMGAFAKELSTSMNSVEIVFFRNVFGVILIALSIYQSLAFFVTLFICSKSEWFKLRYLFGKIDSGIAQNFLAFVAMKRYLDWPQNSVSAVAATIPKPHRLRSLPP